MPKVTYRERNVFDKAMVAVKNDLTMPKWYFLIRDPFGRDTWILMKGFTTVAWFYSNGIDVHDEWSLDLVKEIVKRLEKHLKVKDLEITVY